MRQQAEAFLIRQMVKSPGTINEMDDAEMHLLIAKYHNNGWEGFLADLRTEEEMERQANLRWERHQQDSL